MADREKEAPVVRQRDPVAESRLDAAVARHEGGENVSVTILGVTRTGPIALEAMKALRARALEGSRIKCEAIGARGFELGIGNV
jgi:hypothetical protein